ncbi:hypothetical protein BC332_06171 [Capsicum chinense]|nr:hypothetical protein BC332_06171 [Capsicum chinense]
MGHDTNTGDDDEHMGDDSNNSADDDDFTNVEEDYAGCRTDSSMLTGGEYLPFVHGAFHWIVLWNPSTRESVLLPKSSLSSTVDDDIDVGSTYGLAYDSTSDDYKVLEIDMSGHNNNEILSLKNCSWSIIDHKTSDEMYGEILLPDIMCSLTPSKFGIHIDDHVGVSTLGRMLGVYYKDNNVEEDYAGCTYGLAYDPIRDNYKVFRINMFRPDDNEIFALKNNASWRIIDHKISGRTDSSMLTGGEYLPFVHGAFHWLGMLSRFRVVSFNISDEMYGEISLPEIVCCLTLSKSKVEVDVGVSLLGEMLSVYYKDESFFILWVMKDYGVKDCWMNLFTIPISTGVYRIIPTYMFSDDVVLLCFDHHYGVKPDYLYRVIFSGAFGLSDRMWPLDGAVTIDEDACVYTENEMYGELPLPDIMSSLTPSKFQFEVDDHVGVSMLGGMLGVYYKDKDENLFNLWVMKNYSVKNSWMKLFTIPIGTKFHKIIPIYMYSDNEVLLCFGKEV